MQDVGTRAAGEKSPATGLATLDLPRALSLAALAADKGRQMPPDRIPIQFGEIFRDVTVHIIDHRIRKTR